MRELILKISLVCLFFYFGAFTVQAENVGFLARNGSHLELNGENFYFSAANQYYLFYEDQVMVDEIIEDAHTMGLALIRTWGSSEGEYNNGYCFQPAPGVYDEATFVKLDEVISKANESDINIRLIIPLVNNWDDGFGGIDKYVEWSPTASYHDEFFSDQWCKDAYKAYINYFLNRVNTLTGNAYKNEPTIAILELANEPRVNSGNQAVLQSWIEEMSAYIKSIDSNHLVSIGSEGFGIGGEQGFGSNYVQNNLAPNVDICSFHLFPNYLETYTKLLLHCDGADGSTNFTDSSTSGHAVTANGGAQISTDQYKFGGASGHFNGGSYLSIPASDDWNFSTGDFTIDTWVMPQVLPANNTGAGIYSQYIDANNYIRLYLWNSDGTYFWVFYEFIGGVTKIDFERAATVDTYNWYHIALTRSGNTFRFFQDGIQLGADFINAEIISDLAVPLYIGGGAVGYLDGWLDEIRVSKGVARWTSNFTVPQQPYGAESQPLDWIDAHVDLAHSQIAKPVYMGEYGYLAYRDDAYTATTLYSFDTSTQGWIPLLTSNSDVVTQVESPSKDGNGSIEYNPEFPLGPGQTQDIFCGIEYASVVDYSMHTYLSAWVYLPSGAPDTLSARFFGRTGSGWAWNEGPVINLIPGQWSKIYLDIPAVPNNTQFHDIGVKVMSFTDLYNGNVYFDLVQGLVGDLYNGDEQIGIRNNNFTSWLNLIDSINADGASLWILNGHDETGNLYPDYDHYGVYYPEDLSTCQVIQDFSESMNNKSGNPTFLFDPCEGIDSWIEGRNPDNTLYSDAISVELNSLPEFINQGSHSLKFNYSAPTYNKAYWEKQNLTENWESKSTVLVDLYNPSGATQASIAVVTEDLSGPLPVWNWYEYARQDITAGLNTITVDLSAPDGWYLNGQTEPGNIDDLDKVRKFVVGVFGYTQAGSVYVDNIRIYNAIALLPGWPQPTNGLVLSSPAVGDIDGNGTLDLIVGSYDNNIYAWRADGTSLPGWPQVTNHDVYASPVLGSIDSDSEPEVVVGSIDYNVYAYNGNGTVVPGWPKLTEGAVYSSPAIGDVNGDGQNDVVAICLRQGFLGSKLYIWQGNGTLINSWNIPNNDWVYAAPALADLDNDGIKEIVVATYFDDPGEVYVYNSDGTLLPGWPQETNFYIYSSPAIGDLDNDGSLEIVVGSLDNQVYAWHSNGSLVAGWPQNTGGQIFSSPALADIDGDGRLEIAIGSYNNNMYVFNDDGTLLNGWPKATGAPVRSSPAIADINGDNQLDIIVGSQDMFLYAWNKDGTLVNGWPQRASEQIDSSPVVVDLDGDGKIEIAVGSGNVVYAWDLTGTCPNNATPWPMFRHDKNRTGRYGADPQGPSLSIIYPQEGEAVLTPTPTIRWASTGMSTGEDVKIIITHQNLYMQISKRSVIKNILSAFVSLFDAKPAYAQHLMPLWIEDLNITVDNSGNYTVLPGVLVPGINYTLSLIRVSDPNINDYVHFSVTSTAVSDARSPR